MWQWLAAMNCTYKQWIAHVLKDYSGINPPSERITNVNDPLITAGWKQLTTLVASAGYTHRGNNAYRNKPPQTSQMKTCPRYAKTKRSRTISHTAIDTIYTHNTWSYPVTKIKLTAVIADSQRDEAGVGAEGMEAWSINPEPDMFPLI